MRWTGNISAGFLVNFGALIPPELLESDRQT
jgi:hypothetical protein